MSKGIIKRDQQHNVGAYKTTYQRNPFDSSTPEDIEQYLLEVERKKSSGEGEGEGDGEGYHVRMQSQSSSPHPHIAHSQSGPVIPPASQQPPRAQTMTPPPTHSDNRSTEGKRRLLALQIATIVGMLISPSPSPNRTSCQASLYVYSFATLISTRPVPVSSSFPKTILIDQLRKI